MTWSGGMSLELFREVRTVTLTDEDGSTRLSVTEELHFWANVLHHAPDRVGPVHRVAGWEE
jgi:hypothetical protein